MDLDDTAALEAADPGQMLRAIASSAAQVRQAATLCTEVGLARLADESRPRAVVVAGMGGSAAAGDVLAAVAGEGCPVPITVHRGHGLPGWVGAADLVAAVSSSGVTEETLSATDEAVRRGARLICIGAPGSPLAQRAEQSRAVYVPADPVGRRPRANLWALATPLVLAGEALGLLAAPPAAIEATAIMLESAAGRCRPSSDAFVNPAKSLALTLAGSLPVCWGSSPLTGLAARRLTTQLNENAKYPAIAGVLPEAGHNQVVAFDGPFAGGAATPDLFAERVSEPAPVRLQLVLLREDAEHPQVARRADTSVQLARQRGIVVTELRAEGRSAYERLASLLCLLDYASVYLGLLLGLDPSPIEAIDVLKEQADQR